MRKSDAKLINRAGVVGITALALSLGVAVSQENAEIAKLITPTPTRTALMFVAPLAALASLQYTLAGKTFSFKTLTVEALVLAGAYMWFLAVVLRGFVGTTHTLEDCRWLRGCTEVWQPNSYLTVALVIAGFASVGTGIWLQMRRAT